MNRIEQIIYSLLAILQLLSQLWEQRAFLTEIFDYLVGKVVEQLVIEDNLLNAIQAGIFTPSTRERLESLEQQKEELTIRIAQEEIIKPPIDKDKILFWLHRFRKMDTTKLEHRKRLIDSFVNAIYLYDDKIVFTFNYKDGSKTITMEEIENSALSSDLTSLGAP